MVHLCNMKMLATSIKHKTKGRQYDIDGFISELLASSKFDDLAEKLAAKAANKIMHKALFPVKRATDANDVGNSTEITQEVNQNQSDREYVEKYENNQLNNVELRKDFTGKINPQAVINVTTSLSENLQLKYKYLKKNALEKKVNSNRNPIPKNVTKGDTQNKTTGPADFKEEHNKTESRTLIQNATEKNQNDAIKVSFDENKRSRDDTDDKDDDRKEDPNRNFELNESSHSGADGGTNNSSKKSDHSLEEQGPEHDQPIFREAQNSGPEDKSVVEHERRHIDSEREDIASSLEEENLKPLTRSEENIEELEQNEGEPEKSSTGEMNEEENVIFRAREDSIEDNKVTSNYNPHRGVFRSKSSDGNDDRNSKERFPKDQSSKEHSAEDPNFGKLKPVIRKEGDKLYTYVKAPEYEDYHEKLAKWQKQHPENPADFMK